MPPEQRRAQLVAIGTRLVAESSFEGLSLDQVAVEAGISRSLLFHYFRSKSEFQVALAEAAADELLAATEPDPDLPATQALQRSLHAFVEHISSRREAYLSLVRGASGGDKALQAVFERAHEVVAERVLSGLGMADDAPPLLRAATRGWVAFCEETVVVWLAGGGASTDQVVALLQETLVAAVTATGATIPAQDG